MSDEAKNQTKRQVERVIVTDKLKNKLAALTEQANSCLQGISIISKGDIMNLLLENHPDTLSTEELGHLKAVHFDQVKYTLWLAKRLKEAKAAGEQLSLGDLMAQSSAMIPVTAPKPLRRPRKKKDLVVTEPTREPSSGQIRAE